MRPQVAAPSAWLGQALTELDGELDQALRASPRWRERAHLLLAHLPELGQGSAGVGRRGQARRHFGRPVAGPGAPHPRRDSGAWGGHPRHLGGRRQGRAALSLYRAALVGVRHTPAVRTFYERLLARGTPTKLALTTCRHQRLIILPAVLRTRTPWQPTLLAA